MTSVGVATLPSGSGAPPTRKKDVFRSLVAVGLVALVFLVPFDFIGLTTPLKLLLLLVPLGTILVLGVKRDNAGLRATVAAAVLVCGIQIFTTGSHTGYLPLALLFLAGFQVGLMETWAFSATLAVGVLGSLISIEQWYAKSYSYILAFGTPKLAIVSYGGYRSRGTLGEPLAVAAIFSSILVGAVIYTYKSGLPHRKFVAAALMVILLLVSFATGSRSGFVIPLAVVIGCALLDRSVARNLRMPVFLALISVAVLGGLLDSSGALSPGLLDSRTLSFSALNSTQSYQTRSEGQTVVVTAFRGSSAEIKLLGHGHRALQSYLTDTGDLGLFDTSDNQYLTVLYDYGVAGDVALCIGAILALRRLRTAITPKQFAGAGVLITLLVYGLVVDDLYLLSGSLLAGISVGWARSRHEQSVVDLSL